MNRFVFFIFYNSHFFSLIKPVNSNRNLIVLEKEKTILGIDPGSNVMGYGVIKVVGTKAQIVTLGVVKTSGFGDHYQKLRHIFERTLYLVDAFQPDEAALEAPFYGKNVQSMLKLGRAQGVAMAAALYRGVPIFEYAPLKIKQAITGSGSASKEQVAYFLKQMFNMEIRPKELDATDGLAAAVCHYLQGRNPAKGKSYNSWEEFIRKNPDRIK
ncbi:crossover junction endodeoxyribonuclease RuvC [Prolixibacter bellariivorans]|uniref:Crossover junction endodeoxyribonuclease RuvC n=1 Tax=Prolixibacter bellariivorans TaxID=314319 RepID=A0A5M4AY88_9BACT|nr:crossover junction endodeoxyribonuclease RuvC [Prolixibacter bellariivorans]